MAKLRLFINQTLRATVAFFFVMLVGCATTDTCDPRLVSGSEAAWYGVTGQGRLADCLVDLQAEADRLSAEVTEQQQIVASSNQAARKAEVKLAAVSAKTGPSAREASRIAKELELKQKDLAVRQRELIDLEAKISSLKNSKADKQAQQQQLREAEVALATTKEEIQAITEYLETDLLLRAENAAAYD